MYSSRCTIYTLTKGSPGLVFTFSPKLVTGCIFCVHVCDVCMREEMYVLEFHAYECGGQRLIPDVTFHLMGVTPLSFYTLSLESLRS